MLNQSHNIFLIADHIDFEEIGGGARTSVLNFINNFKNQFNLSYLSLEYLHNHKIKKNNEILLDETKCHYPKTIKTYYKLIIREIKKGKDITFYFNGLYSKLGTLTPLILIVFYSFFYEKPNIVIAPRGGLSSGAMAVKPIRKIFYLKMLKTLGLFKKVRFHVVSEHEKDDVVKILGKTYKSKCYPVGNIVNDQLNLKDVRFKVKSETLQIVFLSRIHPIKNLEFIIKLLNKLNFKYKFDIYGVIDDEKYYKKITKLIDINDNDNINFYGAVSQNEVQNTLSKYDLFLLPTLGENFGHVIFESLSVGTPVVISDQTPWSDEKSPSLWCINLNNLNEWIKTISDFNKLDIENMNLLRIKAKELSIEWLKRQKYKMLYSELFNFK